MRRSIIVAFPSLSPAWFGNITRLRYWGRCLLLLRRICTVSLFPFSPEDLFALSSIYDYIFWVYIICAISSIDSGKVLRSHQSHAAYTTCSPRLLVDLQNVLYSNPIHKRLSSTFLSNARPVGSLSRVASVCLCACRRLLGEGKSRKTTLYFCTFMIMHSLENLASVGSFSYFLPYFLDGTEFGKYKIVWSFFLLMQRLNQECLLQSRCMVLQCIVRRALECEIRVFSVGIPCYCSSRSGLVSE